ncbi:MAG: DUF559 domain-containing protein [Ekhidna sp.]|nr:DUF559 domain-containing protein [Ekhidna sp.]
MAYRRLKKSDIPWLLKTTGLFFEKEVLGIPDRKFRFDFACKDYKIAIEYDGIISAKSRHTSVKGFTTDCEKTNLAQVHGWIVLRYTALNLSSIIEQIELAKKLRDEIN